MKSVLALLLTIFLIQGCAKVPVKAGNIFSVEGLGFHDTGEKFVAIDQHLLLTNKGNVYSLNTGFQNKWGPWKGIPKDVYLGRPTSDFIGRIEFLQNIKKMIVANNSYIALTTSGDVLTWGGADSKHGGDFCSSQQGRKSAGVQRLPRKINDGNVVVDVNYKDCVSSFLTEDGVVYRWGYRGRSNRSSLPRLDALYNKSLENELLSNLVFPQKIIFPFKVHRIRYGGIISEGRDLYSLLDVESDVTVDYMERKDDYLFRFENKDAPQENGLVNEGVVLESGKAFFMPVMVGGIDQIVQGRIYGGAAEYGRVKFISYKSFVNDVGDIYRWGHVSFQKSDDLFFPSLRKVKNTYEKKPLLVKDCVRNIKYFSRDSYVTELGDVYVYGSSYAGLYSDALIYAGYPNNYSTEMISDYHKIIKSKYSDLGNENY